MSVWLGCRYKPLYWSISLWIHVSRSLWVVVNEQGNWNNNQLLASVDRLIKFVSDFSIQVDDLHKIVIWSYWENFIFWAPNQFALLNFHTTAWMLKQNKFGNHIFPLWVSNTKSWNFFWPHIEYISKSKYHDFICV